MHSFRTEEAAVNMVHDTVSNHRFETGFSVLSLQDCRVVAGINIKADDS
jgi:hypothetical protein